MSVSELPLSQFCLILPVDPTPREISRLQLSVRSLGGRIACVVGPALNRWPNLCSLLDETNVPCLSWIEFEQKRSAGKIAQFDAAISLAETQPIDLQHEIPAPHGTWAFFEGDPRYDSEAAGLGDALAQGRSRVAMTLMRTNISANGGGLLAFADVPRRPWDNIATLHQRLDAYLPQMIKEACERAAIGGKVEVEVKHSGQRKLEQRFRPLRERLTDAKFLTHMLFNKATSLFAKNRSVILLLHNPLPDVLDSTLAILRRIGPFVPHSKIISDLTHGRPLTPGFALTFDDGYKENMALLDVLDRHECPAMFFLNTATIDEKSALWFMNPDKDFLAKKTFFKTLDYAAFLTAVDREGLTHPSALRGRFGLRSEDVRTLLARGHEIGIHTHNHPFLTRLTDDEIRTEVAGCWTRLRSISGDQQLPLHFAYPDGDHDERVVNVLAELGAVSAVTTRPGPVHAGGHLLKIPRYALGDDDYPGLALFKLTSLYPALQAARN